jgi:predicted dehydrogenase
VSVLAQTHAFIPQRIDPESGQRRPVGTPDSVQVLTELQGGAQAVYHLSGVLPFGQEQSITLYGSAGVLQYDLAADHIRGASKTLGQGSARSDSLQEIAIPPKKVQDWRVEADFVDSIRQGTPVRLTDFRTGVAYMEFTEAVWRSARNGNAVQLPLG